MVKSQPLNRFYIDVGISCSLPYQGNVEELEGCGIITADDSFYIKSYVILELRLVLMNYCYVL